MLPSRSQNAPREGRIAHEDRYDWQEGRGSLALEQGPGLATAQGVARFASPLGQ